MMHELLSALLIKRKVMAEPADRWSLMFEGDRVLSTPTFTAIHRVDYPLVEEEDGADDRDAHGADAYDRRGSTGEVTPIAEDLRIFVPGVGEALYVSWSAEEGLAVITMERGSWERDCFGIRSADDRLRPTAKG